MTTPAPPAAATMVEIFDHISVLGFTPSGGGYVHHHDRTGVRVVVNDLRAVAVTVYAADVWFARLTRPPLPVFAAVVAAAIRHTSPPPTHSHPGSTGKDTTR